MRFVFLGAGAVGGYYGALLARSGQSVGFVARGAHLDAIRAHGIGVISSAVGDFTARVDASAEPAALGHADVVIVAIKTYDNAAALPLITPLLGPETTVLTLQNGVDSAEDVAAVVGDARTIAGATYIATAIDGPGVIKQTGSHRRIVFGECVGRPSAVSDRVARLADVMRAADIHADPVADVRPALWEKFAYLAPFAAFTGAARLPIGPLWADPPTRETFLAAIAEVARIAEASGIPMPPDLIAQKRAYCDVLPPSTRSSLLIDLSQGKRIEVEALQGSVVRRGAAAGVPTPVMSALYAVLKPHAGGAPPGAR
jgi:2-dehydropantoate 2-reductase